MTVRVPNRLRRMAAGLVVLAVLVLSVGQTFAMSVGGSTSFNETSHSDHHALMTPPDGAHNHSGLPCEHDRCPQGRGYRIACGCSVQFTWFPAVAPAPLATAPRALIWYSIAAMAPDGAATAPAVPPSPTHGLIRAQDRSVISGGMPKVPRSSHRFLSRSHRSICEREIRRVFHRR